jgi:uncharacterized protein DUF4401
VSAADLIAAMRERGLIPADAPAPMAAPEDRPWFISLLLGLAGWLAGIFALVFIGIFFDVEKPGQLLYVGLALLLVAWGLYFASRAMVFLDQLALALSIAGQFGVAVFFFDKLRDALPIMTAILGLQLALFVLMPDRIARTISAFFASLAWVYVVRFALRPGQGENIFFDSNPAFTLPRFGDWTLPIEWLLTWAPLIALLAWLMRTETRWMARGTADFARPAITGLLLGLALGGIGAEPFASLAVGIDEIGLQFHWYALFPLLSIGLALFAAYGAFKQRSSALTGVAVVAALAHLGRFYYLYGTTLTWKSVIMLFTGIGLLATATLLARRAGGAPA